jgi:hypothetical protein
MNSTGRGDCETCDLKWLCTGAICWRNYRDGGDT